MKWFNVQTISKLLIPFICSLTFLAVPAKTIAQDYEDETASFRDKAIVIGGVILAGGIAGAIAGNMNKHHSHSGSSGSTGLDGPRGPGGPGGPGGPRGPLGPGPFVPDIGETLTFNFDFINISEVGTGTYIFFVTLPDGTVVEGTPAPLPPIGSAFSGVLTIVDPVFGTYHPGIQIIADTSPVLIAVAGTITVEASRDGSTTTVLASDLVLEITGGQEQAQADFTYGEANVP